MRQTGSKVTRWLLAALAALLVCGQSSAITHELGHDLLLDRELCATCSVGAGLQAAADARAPAIETHEANRAVLPVTEPAPTEGFRNRNEARAPPHTS